MIQGLMYINGEFKVSKDRGSFIVKNPYTLETIGTQADCCDEDLESALEGAVTAFSRYKSTSAYERARLLRSLHRLMLEEQATLAEMITLENGKPLTEALTEVMYAAGYIEWYAEEALRINGEILQSHVPKVKMHVLKEPIGPVGIITPWNFPLAMFVRKLAPALAAGCTVVVKPAEQTPLTAFKFFELIDRVGFEPGVCQLVTGDAPTIGKAMMAHPKIAKVSFTGSTEVGQLLASQSGLTLKKLSLELGGHAPLLVFDDCNLDKAVQGALDSKFRNCGQVCIATNRVLVQSSILTAFTDKLVERVNQLKIGNGLEGVDLGPLIDEVGFNKVKSHVRDAIALGAHLECGGEGYRVEQGDLLGGFLFQPTVLTSVTTSMKVFNEETFGPILPIISFESEEEAIELANQTPFGLASYAFTEQLGRAHRLMEGLAYGMVGINTGKISAAQAPFGGVKMSGYGREGGSYGLEDYLVTKYVAIGI